MKLPSKVLIGCALGMIMVISIGVGYYFLNFKPRQDFRKHVSSKLHTLKAVIQAENLSPMELNRYSTFLSSDLHKSGSDLSSAEKQNIKKIIHLIAGFETFTILHRKFDTPIRLGPTTRSLIEPYVDILGGTAGFYTSPSLESYRFAAKEKQRTSLKIEQARSKTEKENLQIWKSAQESVLQSPPPPASKDFINPKTAAASILSQIDDLIDDLHVRLAETPLFNQKPTPGP